MRFGIVGDLIACSRPKNEYAAVFKFGVQFAFDAQEDMAFDTPVVGQVAGRVFDHPDPDAAEVLRLPVGNAALAAVFGAFNG